MLLHVKLDYTRMTLFDGFFTGFFTLLFLVCGRRPLQIQAVLRRVSVLWDHPGLRSSQQHCVNTVDVATVGACCMNEGLLNAID